MSKLRFLMAGVIGAVLAACLTFGLQAAAQSPSTLTTIYACVKSGDLSHVKTSAPKCPAGSKPIQWNSFPASANGMPQCTGIPYEGIDLSGCDLEGASFVVADLTGANFSQADLSDALFVSDSSSQNPAVPTLEGADFDGANLSGSNWVDVDVSDVNFSDANLTDIDTSGLSGTPASLPTDWVSVGGYFVGPTTNLVQQDLNGLDLRGDDLAGADLSRAGLTDTVLATSNLTGADLAGTTLNTTEFNEANLTDANLDNAVEAPTASFAGVIWSNTTCPDGTNSNNDGDTCLDNLNS
jgi:uncharacterized protein YjbI with pentapeptide repeats